MEQKEAVEKVYARIDYLESRIAGKGMQSDDEGDAIFELSELELELDDLLEKNNA